MRTALKKDEKLLLITRQHWVKLLLPIFAWLIVGVVVFLLDLFTTQTKFIIVLVAAIFPLLMYLNWLHNLWAVTSTRVIDETGFISRYSKESPLDKINNVEYTQSVWGRVFGYGDVDIQTAAEMGETVYDLIHHPKVLKDTITQAQEEYKQLQIANQADQLAAAIARANGSNTPSHQMIAIELEKLFELQQKGAITPEEYQLQKNKLMK